ncbi:MAG: response regulator [Desulfocurvibacter africanus]
MRILIIEDDPVSALYMRETLAEFGQADLAEDGRKGLRAFERALSKHQPYDVLFVDLMMPRMDGHQTLEKIRALENSLKLAPQQRVKAIVVSASEDQRHVTRAFFRGEAVAYLNKPVTRERVAEELHRFGLA